MAFAFTVEDGTGVEDANAYIDLPFARAYHESRGQLGTWDGEAVTSAITSASAGADTLTIAAHPFRTGDGPVRFVGDDLPAPLAEETDYWLVSASTTTVQVATSYANASAASPTIVNITDAGSGSMTVSHPSFDAQRQAIVRATDYVETRYGERFHGEKGSAEQGLFFPAEGIYDENGEVEGVPVILKRAIAELALSARSESLDPTSSSGAVISESRSAGGISRSVTYAAPSTTRSFPAAERWLKPLLRPLQAVRA